MPYDDDADVNLVEWVIESSKATIAAQVGAPVNADLERRTKIPEQTIQ
jgi:hypothetical protein